MSDLSNSRLPRIIDERFDALLSAWTTEQLVTTRRGAISDGNLRAQCSELFAALRLAFGNGGRLDLQGTAWSGVRDILQRISATRAQHGFTPTETATFVLSLEKPLFETLRAATGKDADALADETWIATELLDKLALLTTESFMRTREELIARQQQDMMELSTPVAKLWEGVLALPMIGTLDSAPKS